MSAGSSTEVFIPKQRFYLSPIMFSILTLGIYGLVWLYKIHNEMLNHTKDPSISPGKVLGFLFIPIFNAFWAIYLMFHVPGLIKNMELSDDIPMHYQTNAGLIGVLGVIPFLNICWAPLVQNALNRHWEYHTLIASKGENQKMQILQELKKKYAKRIYVPILVGVGVIILAMIIIASLVGH